LLNIPCGRVAKVEEIASLKLKIFERSFGPLVPQAEELIDAHDGVSC
jgi:hypothetical protein